MIIKSVLSHKIISIAFFLLVIGILLVLGHEFISTKLGIIDARGNVRGNITGTNRIYGDAPPALFSLGIYAIFLSIILFVIKFITILVNNKFK